MHPADEGMWKRYSKHPPVQKDATGHLDQADLPHHSLAECLPNKDSHVSNDLAVQDRVQTQAIFGQALQAPVWEVLQGPRWACADKNNGDSVNASDCPQPNR